RLFGIDPHQPVPEETEEEIRLMLEAGKEKGTIEDMEQFIITRAFEFNDKAVADIMVHRTDIIAISADDSLDDIVHLATLHPFSKFPVYQDDKDHMIGSIHIKDLFRYR
ncbi:CBS domain-containing protein, partial [Streptococcus pneumoniae]|nr:CBS domain-containing protein [Streptococcus pneumoniae]